MEKGRVCVTGAGGFLASWVVEVLLSQGYVVHGTARDPGDAKNAHLNKLAEESGKLKIFKADLLDYDSLRSAIDGCIGVLHVASPVPPTSVPNPELELLEPAVTGTLNVLKASATSKVRRVVYVSSVASVMMNPNLPKDRAMDEACWSDKEYCRKTGISNCLSLLSLMASFQNWYCLSKTEAESQAFDYAKSNGLDLVSICPSLILGPLLQPTLNASSAVLVNLLKGMPDPAPNRIRHIVDVRDVAAAVILAYEKPEAEGRYICSSHTINTVNLVEKLRSLFPDYNYPKNFTVGEEWGYFSNERLKMLGWTCRPLEETLVDAIRNYQGARLLLG
ncbi:hypothetical protein MLD38_024858 [Melastoma candidum]|uniref:Uncharacterized protein n=1 Tax=Melastoma candidum TaxID=119954 RepID=A0ACB9NYQ2_9MYRT|nr:hypothetical protein MLD38_024858 [Melastoma candidum]